MKRRALAYRMPGEDPVSTNFVRGFVATGLLAALPADAAGKSSRKDRKVLLRQALQGGIALAAGSSAAGALQRRDYSAALAAVTGGAVGLIAVDYLLRKPVRKDNKDHEEKALG